jgi:hypothetical protein
VCWFEKRSKPRLAGLLENRLTLSALGVAIFGCALASFFAPPFSGLDTVPSLGAVVMSLGLILKDALMVGVGLLLGLVGAGLVIALGSAAAHLLF